MSAQQAPDWPEPLPWTPPPGGLVAADLDRMPGLPPRTELIDGGLFFMSPQRLFHALVIKLLDAGLGVARPRDLRVRMNMSVVIGPQDRTEPDVLLVAATAESGVRQTSYPAEAVLLAVEVISPESENRDRRIKPRLYAQAGIRHFWLVEENDGFPVVYVHELNQATSTYELSGIHHGRLKLAVPYDIDVNLTAITNL